MRCFYTEQFLATVKCGGKRFMQQIFQQRLTDTYVTMSDFHATGS